MKIFPPAPISFLLSMLQTLEDEVKPCYGNAAMDSCHIHCDDVSSYNFSTIQSKILNGISITYGSIQKVLSCPYVW